jgi:UDP-glucuronate 4-epimerase
MKNILVTGGAGFIGSHLVDRLLSEGQWRVFVVDDLNDFYDPAIKLANASTHENNSNYQLFKADIRDQTALQKIFAAHNFDCIVHLNLLEQAREHGIKQFVFGSSSSVYGVNAKVPFAEDDPIRQPISPYAATKAAGELICHTYTHLYGIRSVCLRFFTVYGPRQRPDLAIHKFARLISEDKRIPVFGDGTTRRDYTFIDDIIAGVRSAIDYDRTDYEVINLGESRTVELRELIALLEKELGKTAQIDRQPLQPGDVPQTFADIAKARRLLGYNPQTQIEEGIRTFVRWFQENNA